MEQKTTHRNHYVPRFYLKNWSMDGNTIHTYSILVSNSKVPYWTQQSIRTSAVWNDFYTRLEGDKEVDDFEHWFDRKFEAPAKPIFKKLLSDCTLTLCLCAICSYTGCLLEINGAKSSHISSSTSRNCFKIKQSGSRYTKRGLCTPSIGHY